MIARKMLPALKAMEEKGVMHRDLHNGQVMIKFRGLEGVDDYRRILRTVKRKLLFELNEEDVDSAYIFVFFLKL